MYLQTLTPYRKPGTIQNEIDNLLHDFFGGAIHTGPIIGDWLPAAEITETRDRFFIKAELPGMDEKDMDLDIRGNVLTIRGEKKNVKEDRGENHYLGDRYYGSFRRTFQLPADVDPEHAEATFKKGVLRISLPKVAESKTRKIEIKA